MARPTKQGIDYFPIDVQFDDKVELFIVENGAEGLGILVTIWQLIYQNEGYYIKNNDDLVLLVRRRVLSSLGEVKKVINAALARGIFDQHKESELNVLTSKAIQKRFFVASARKKIVNVNKNYIYECINTGDNVVYDVKNATKEEVEVEEEVEEETITPSPDGELVGESDKIPLCPHRKIIDIYHKELPSLTKVSLKLWGGERERHLRARWKEQKERQDLAWWTGFFRKVANSAFLLGQKSKFSANLGWLIKPENFIKVLEGNFDDGDKTPVQSQSTFDYSALQVGTKVAMKGKAHIIEEGFCIRDSSGCIIPAGAIRKMYQAGEIAVIQ